jgi:hypothetical protein
VWSGRGGIRQSEGSILLAMNRVEIFFNQAPKALCLLLSWPLIDDLVDEFFSDDMDCMGSVAGSFIT